jgi:hypothetical protein
MIAAPRRLSHAEFDHASVCTGRPLANAEIGMGFSLMALADGQWQTTTTTSSSTRHDFALESLT